MISIDTVYKNVSSLLRKNQQGRITPDEFNRYANIGNNARFNELYGRTEDYKPNQAKATVAYAETQQIDEKLSVFLVSDSLTIDSSGRANKPTGLLRIDSMKHIMTSGSIKKVRRVNKDQEAMWADSSNMPPTEEYPFYVDYGNYYQFYPKNLGTASINYLKQPVDVKWNYTLDGNGRPVYSQTGTVDFAWEGSEIGKITSLILELVSVSVQDQTGLSFGTQKEIKGE